MDLYFISALVFSLSATINAVAPPPPDDAEFDGFVQPRTTFRDYYVTHDGLAFNYHPSTPSVRITATDKVPDIALTKATEIISHMVKYMPDDIFAAITKTGGVGLFSSSEGLTVYPEFQKYANRPECNGRCDGACANTCTSDGRKWSTMVAMTTSRTLVLDDNVMCSAQDPYRGDENLLVQEFGQLLFIHMPTVWKDKVFATFQNAKSKQLWTLGQYAMIDAYTYWRQATQAFFMVSKRTDVTSGLNMCGTSNICPDEASARAYIKKHDPKLADILEYVYTNRRPNMRGELKPCI